MPGKTIKPANRKGTMPKSVTTYKKGGSTKMKKKRRKKKKY